MVVAGRATGNKQFTSPGSSRPAAQPIRTGGCVQELRTTELGNELGNLLQRTVTMVRSYRAGAVPAAAVP